MGRANSFRIAVSVQPPSVFRTNELDPKVEIAYEIRSAPVFSLPWEPRATARAWR